MPIFKRNTIALLLPIAAILLAPSAFAFAALTVTSPDGNLTLSFQLKSNGAPYKPGVRPYYSVTYKKAGILADSPLGLNFLGAAPLETNLTITGTSLSTQDEFWQNPFGPAQNIRDHYHQLTVSLAETNGLRRRLKIIFRAYNEGVAFRYDIPEQPAIQGLTLSSESTGFYFTDAATVFALNLGSFTTPYESEFKQESIDEIKPESIIGLPLLLHLSSGPWVALLEADLTDYAGMYVGGAEGVTHGLASKLSPLPNHPDEAVIASTPKATPWRVVMVNSRPGGLIESSDLILNLSQPSVLKDTSWIEPGKSAWDWWSGDYDTGVSFKPGMNTPTIEHYIDFASAHGLQYMLIDAGWSPKNDILHWVPAVNLPEILKVARQKHIKILLWMHWTNVKRQIDQAFPLFEKWGVAGVKIDFMNRDDQEMVNFYEEMVSKAAAHHLVVDLHGAFKPTGLRRTYPNLLTREGVMGMEYSKWSRRTNPVHDVTLPFTRMLAGPFDYTPGCFNNATESQFVPRQVNPMCQGTRAHQLAMYAVFFSPLAMLADYPEDYDHHTGMEFLERIPTVWDETKVLNGQPAQYITVARRKNHGWYLGSMTDWAPRDFTLPLKFLGPGQYLEEVFADGPDAAQNPKSIIYSKKWVKSTDTLSLHLAPGGGAAVIFTLAPGAKLP
ncbi:MAG TPA: glycoside hydrolase family 97 protein [Terriglobia bacterium]|nr:glycoside hydrolase family 97 protein [Terriglobia bacterium]